MYKPEIIRAHFACMDKSIVVLKVDPADNILSFDVRQHLVLFILQNMNMNINRADELLPKNGTMQIIYIEDWT